MRVAQHAYLVTAQTPLPENCRPESRDRQLRRLAYAVRSLVGSPSPLLTGTPGQPPRHTGAPSVSRQQYCCCCLAGSGKERGHGRQLTACPRCYTKLRPGTHHVVCKVLTDPSIDAMAVRFTLHTRPCARGS